MKRTRMARMVKLSRLLVTIALLLALAVMAAPARADAPVIEKWTFDSSPDASMGVFINTTNLQVQSIWINNLSKWDRWLYITSNGVITFEIISPAFSGYIETPISNFKFRRIPHTDPDDPDGISYQPNTSMSFSYAD